MLPSDVLKLIEQHQRMMRQGEEERLHGAECSQNNIQTPWNTESVLDYRLAAALEGRLKTDGRKRIAARGIVSDFRF